MSQEADEILFPRAILIDQREKGPYSFTGIHADADQGRRPIRVLTRTVKLATGDYSLVGLENEIAVERKSLEDCFSTLGQGRDRFIKELERLSGLKVAAVVVEAEWSTILNSPPEGSQLNPKTIIRSVLTWNVQFPTIHWHFLPGRRVAELVTFRVLERHNRRRGGSSGEG
jgi:ERCC4-type nuclease